MCVLPWRRSQWVYDGNCNQFVRPHYSWLQQQLAGTSAAVVETFDGIYVSDGASIAGGLATDQLVARPANRITDCWWLVHRRHRGNKSKTYSTVEHTNTQTHSRFLSIAELFWQTIDFLVSTCCHVPQRDIVFDRHQEPRAMASRSESALLIKIIEHLFYEKAIGRLGTSEIVK